MKKTPKEMIPNKDTPIDTKIFVRRFNDWFPAHLKEVRGKVFDYWLDGMTSHTTTKYQCTGECILSEPMDCKETE